MCVCAFVENVLCVLKPRLKCVCWNCAWNCVCVLVETVPEVRVFKLYLKVCVCMCMCVCLCVLKLTWNVRPQTLPKNVYWNSQPETQTQSQIININSKSKFQACPLEMLHQPQSVKSWLAYRGLGKKKLHWLGGKLEQLARESAELLILKTDPNSDMGGVLKYIFRKRKMVLPWDNEFEVVDEVWWSVFWKIWNLNFCFEANGMKLWCYEFWFNFTSILFFYQFDWLVW